MTKLPRRWIKFLSKKPETRMGSQDVEIRFNTGEVKEYIVYNSEIIYSNLVTKSIRDIRLTHHSR